MRFLIQGLGALALALAGSTSVQAQGPQPLPSIGSISGRVLDSTSGQPLIDPRAFVQLLRCNPGRVCETLTDVVEVDDLGRFRLESTPERPIPAGSLTVEARAPQYFAERLVATVDEGANVDVGDIGLERTGSAVLISPAQTCTIPDEGGRCDYAISIENFRTLPLVGAFFSRVEVIASSEPLAYLTRFEANPLGGDRDIERVALAVPPGRRQVVPFSFDVPASLPNGTEICVNAFLGFPEELRTASATTQFCTRKGSTELVPERPVSVLARRDFVIDSAAIAFENLQLCPTFPLSGGTCEYSVDVVNRDALPFEGVARSSAEALSVFLRATFFELTGGGGEADVMRPEVKLEPFGRTTLTFRLDVPDLQPARNYTPICTRLYLGAEPTPLFTPVREEPLFCLIRTENGYEAVDDRVLPQP